MDSSCSWLAPKALHGGKCNKLMATTYLLLYHGLDSEAEPTASSVDASDLNIVVKETAFRDQLKTLLARGTAVITLEEMLAQSQAQECEQVVLTFDDGHKSNWSLAMPALIDVGLTAIFYIVAGEVDKNPEYVTSDQLREMSEQGMEIGSHTMTHQFLSQLSRDEMRYELADSKKRLEEIIQKPVLDLAIPGGHYKKTVIHEARECGYRSVTTCKVGVFQARQNPMEIPRLEIRRNLDLDAFQKTFCESTVRKLQAFELAKSCVRKTVGLDFYTGLRRAAHRIISINR